jgi:hypothetical protein
MLWRMWRFGCRGFGREWRLLRREGGVRGLIWGGGIIILSLVSAVWTFTLECAVRLN